MSTFLGTIDEEEQRASAGIFSKPMHNITITKGD
jgi:hypothetical protein